MRGTYKELECRNYGSYQWFNLSDFFHLFEMFNSTAAVLKTKGLFSLLKELALYLKRSQQLLFYMGSASQYRTGECMQRDIVYLEA